MSKMDLPSLTQLALHANNSPTVPALTTGGILKSAKQMHYERLFYKALAKKKKMKPGTDEYRKQEAETLRLRKLAGWVVPMLSEEAAPPRAPAK